MFDAALTLRRESGCLAGMGAKDWLVEKAGMAVLNQAVLKPYGSITKLKLDTTARTIEAELELKGETERLRLHVQEYELRQEGDRAFVIIKSIETSREWLTTAARDFAVDKPFELPDSVKKFLPMIL
jgi:hypothetical protein